MIPLDLVHLIATFGYGAVLLLVTIESAGIPVPGETILLVAAISAGATHHLSIVLVIVAATTGAILGDNLGYWVGATGGVRLLLRNRRLVRRLERKLKLGLVLFQQHGGKVVFFGRFVTALRMWAALLAGLYQLRWSRFLLFNAFGAIVWATGYGLGGYLLGTTIYQLTGPLGWGLLGLTGCLLLALALLFHRQEQRWEERAVRLFPDPLEHYLNRGGNYRAKQYTSARTQHTTQEETMIYVHQSALTLAPSLPVEILPQTIFDYHKINMLANEYEIIKASKTSKIWTKSLDSVVGPSHDLEDNEQEWDNSTCQRGSETPPPSNFSRPREPAYKPLRPLRLERLASLEQ